MSAPSLFHLGQGWAIDISSPDINQVVPVCGIMALKCSIKHYITANSTVCVGMQGAPSMLRGGWHGAGCSAAVDDEVVKDAGELSTGDVGVGTSETGRVEWRLGEVWW